MLKDFSSEVIQNISSYLIGEPKYVRLNNSKALKTIQHKYKTQYGNLWTDVDYYNGILEEFMSYDVEPKIRNLNYSLSLILKQSEKIRNLLKQSY